ncbi:MAG: right-handed parallel beta-helix repeat-containing protein, partial [Bryobacteraceae bacterium]
MKLLFAIVLTTALTLQSATYYVNSTAGSDANAGTSEQAAWKTLNRINAARFHPGDRILFKSGSVFDGQLAPKSSGAEGAPIVIDRYGKGPRPRIDGGGQVEDVVRLYNVQFIEVKNLEVTNHGADPAVRRGVHIFLDNFGTGHHIVLAGLYIHDVNGSNKRKDNGGIIFRTNGDKIPSRFDGLTIERNIVWKVDRSAIAAQSYHWNRLHWNPSLHVVIRDNLVDDIGGDGIVPWATDGALIENNIARNCNRRAATYNAGIWPWSTDNSLFQLNEASL